MKKFIFYGAGLIFAFISAATIGSNTTTGLLDDGNQTQQRFQDFAIEKIEGAGWRYLRTFFADELEYEQGWADFLGEYISDYAPVISKILVPIFSLVGGMAIDGRYGDADVIKVATGMTIISTIGMILSDRIISFTGRLLTNKSDICLRSLNTFVGYWEEYKKYTPLALHAFFEELSRDYEVNDYLTVITAQDARIIVEGLFSASLLAEQLEMGLDNQKNASHKPAQVDKIDHSDMAALSDLFIKTKLITSLLSYENSPDKNRTEKWEYVAKCLSILNPPVLGLADHVKKYELPIVIGAALPLGFFVGPRLAKLLFRDTSSDVIVGGKFTGSFVAVALASMACRLLSADPEIKKHHDSLVLFIRNWKAHKEQAPISLHQLFDELFKISLKNGKSFTLNDTFVQEIYRIISQTWLKESSLAQSDKNNHIRDYEE